MVSPLMGTLNTLNVNLVKCNGPDWKGGIVVITVGGSARLWFSEWTLY